MKKRKILFLLTAILLFALIKGQKIKNLSDLALESFSQALKDPFLTQVFDVQKEEAIAVFGNGTEDSFV